MFKQLFHATMFPKMLEIEVHDGFSGHSKPEVPGFNDTRMNGTHRHLEYAFPMNKMTIDRSGRLAPLQDRIPWEIFL